MIFYTKKEDCCGCSSCMNICPSRAIKMCEDEEGFLYPNIDTTVCVNCNLCEVVCPVLNQSKEQKPLNTYAAKNPNEQIRMESSSGGVFTMLAEQVILQGGIVFGAKFNEDWKVIHDYTETVEGLAPFRGSKYVQSDLGHKYNDVKSFLENNRLVLFSGTPCQIRGLKLFLKKDYNNLITVDFVCHGVPSPKVFNLYLTENIIQKGDKISSIKFKDKRLGWHLSSFTARGTKSIIHTASLQDDLFLKGFLHNLYLRPSCHTCPSKSLKSNADITLGDYWGIESYMPDFDDDKGVSYISINAKNGEKLFSTIKNKLTFRETNYSTYIRYNTAIVESTKVNEQQRKIFFDELNTRGIISAFKKTSNQNINLKTLIKEIVISGLTRINADKIIKHYYRTTKHIINSQIDNLTYVLARFLILFYRPKLGEKTLLIPAAELDGGFGDDIMVLAFTNQLKKKTIEIFTNKSIPREDLFKDYNNVILSGGFKPKNYFAILNKLKGCTDLYILGADIMDGAYGNEKIRFRLMQLAHQMNVNVHLCGLSVSINISKKAINEFKKVSSFTTIKTREKDSFNRLKKHISNNKLILTCDIAFLTPLSNSFKDDKFLSWIKSQKEQEKIIIAICPNNIQAYKLGIDKYIADFENLLSYLRDNFNCAFIFLYHDLRIYKNTTTDMQLSKYLYYSFTDISFFSDKIKNGLEVKNYIRYADMTLTGRMHFGISGYTMGIPMFGISYQNKFEGLQTYFGIPIDYSLTDFTNINDAIKRINPFITNLKKNKREIAERLPGIKENCLINFQ